MIQPHVTMFSDQRPSRSEAIAVYVIYASIIARTITWPYIQHLLGWYLSLELLSVVLFSLVLWRPGISPKILHLYFAFQSLLILVLFSVWPDFDFVAILFVPLCYQAALVLSDKARQWWIVVILLLQGSSMTYFQGTRGLALALLPMVGGFLFAAQVILNRQLIADRRQSQEMLAELQAVNQKLQAYALQVEELTTLEERNRLARELHDSVSQSLFSITLNARAAQILLERDPERVRSQLELLQNQTQVVLDEMRKFITGLRAKEA